MPDKRTKENGIARLGNFFTKWVSHTRKMNRTPKSTHPLLSQPSIFHWQQASHTDWVRRFHPYPPTYPGPLQQQLPVATWQLCDIILCTCLTHVASYLPLVLLLSLGHLGALWVCVSVRSFSTKKCNGMNHACTGCLRYVCLCLPTNFSIWFPISTKSDRGENDAGAQSPHRLCKNKHIEEIGKAMGQPGLQLIDLLDSITTHVCAWLVGNMHPPAGSQMK